MNTYSPLLSYLKNAQLSDGSFENSPFQTSLIIICLRHIKNNTTAKIISRHAISYLFSQASLQCSWNYWDRSQPKSQTLPDDLDDTSMALAAISIHEPGIINENMLLSFVKNLVSTEIKEGGPYYSWIVPESFRESWNDVDPVVNSNIGYALHLQNIKIAPLGNFLELLISENEPPSKYYSPLHFYYFLSRWYTCSKNKIMKQLVRTYPTINTNLERAIFVSTYKNLGGDINKISHEIKQLSQVKPSQLTSDPFYIEEIENNTPTYAQSKSLTAACIIEALTFPQETLSQNTSLIETVSDLAESRFSNAPKVIQNQISEIVKKMKSHKKAPEIFLLPYLWHRSMRIRYQKAHSEKDITELCVASVLGWIGFGIYDDIIDGENKQTLIPLANICVREVSAILKNGKSILDTIDHANAWENSTCKVSVIDNILELPKILPHYGDLHQLAHKSLGHALGPMILTPFKKDQVKKFFIHYLIARQLNDDAHDWLEDLRNGFLNPMSVLVIKRYCELYPNTTHINLDTDREVLQSLFWYEVIDTVVRTIQDHLKQARTVIKKLNLFDDYETIDILLTPLEQSAEQALRERDSAIRFIEKYR
jgi:hypothetical protein